MYLIKNKRENTKKRRKAISRKKFFQPDLNWRPSACEADVITTCSLLFQSSSSLSLCCKVLDKLPLICSRRPLCLDVKNTILFLEAFLDPR